MVGLLDLRDREGLIVTPFEISWLLFEARATSSLAEALHLDELVEDARYRSVGEASMAARADVLDDPAERSAFDEALVEVSRVLRSSPASVTMLIDGRDDRRHLVLASHGERIVTFELAQEGLLLLSLTDRASRVAELVGAGLSARQGYVATVSQADGTAFGAAWDGVARGAVWESTVPGRPHPQDRMGAETALRTLLDRLG